MVKSGSAPDTGWQLSVSCMAAVALLCITSAVTSNQALNTVATAVAVAAILGAPRDKVPAAVLFMAPIASMLTMPVLIAVAVAKLLLSPKGSQLGAAAPLAILGLLIIEGLGSIGHDWSLSYFLGLGAYFVFLMLTALTQQLAYDAHAAVVAFVSGYGSLAVIVAISQAHAEGWATLLKPTYRIGHTVGYRYASGLVLNPNQLGILSALVISAVVTGVITRKLSAAWVVMVPVGLWFGLLSGSRTLLVGVAVALIFLVVGGLIRFRSGLALAVSSAAFVLLLSRFAPSVSSVFVSRFTDANDLSGGRLDLNSMYMDRAGSTIWSALFGSSMQNYKSALDTETSTHSFFVETWVSWGGAGVMLVVLLLGLLVAAVRRANTTTGAADAPVGNALAPWGTFVSLLVMLQFSHGFANWGNIVLLLAAQAVAALAAGVEGKPPTPKAQQETEVPASSAH